MSVMILWLFVASCAGLVMTSPKCHPRLYGRTLRALPQSDEPSLDDPTTRELFGVVTRAELSVGLNQVKASVDALTSTLLERQNTLAEKQSGDLKALAERQSGDVRVLAEQLKSSSDRQAGDVRVLAEQLKSSSDRQAEQLKALSEKSEKQSEQLENLTEKVERFGKVTTEFDLYKGGFAVVIGGLVVSVIRYFLENA
eukprot:CAMPEP_0197302028 /NCGR_PEP_ID=MMETSP0890-20130614/50783_1 /TAXON_ID=44058 ORGANISM="Aureoumbra lagunensis, Strain CCMP1510" /NCGR_SAMPLE_ID=MMETSP0890 /ASSEMBLY_ACC=CAM_ASM_000533 /LENGTH=197 /DNA_ID=CAMNT_0042781509 /DNA_START=441 /DNA_END=1034 /DNA_ORIENTATION=-